MPKNDQPKEGLRERKKAKTRATIQQNALQLFRDQGYDATTIEQIAEASEISPSTFFRYFPTKEAVVLEDDYDPMLIKAFKEQPIVLSPLQALRKAMLLVMGNFTEAEHKANLERMSLAMSVPELRAAALSQMTETIQMIAENVADRVKRDRNDLAILTFAGAVTGAMISVQFYIANHPEADFVQSIDYALESLENGLPL